MWQRARRWALVAAITAAAVTLGSPAADARPRRAYWMVSFLGGALVPVAETADQRDLGLGVGLRVGFTSKIGFGLALSLDYSPLPVAEVEGSDDVVTENHFVAGAVMPRFTIGNGAVRLSLGAGGGAIMEQTRSRPAGDRMADQETATVFSTAAQGEVGLETYLWESGGLTLNGSYMRSFGERDSQVAAVLGGLIFTFR